MTREEFNNVKIGDVVEITMHGNNKGKKGTIKDIKRDQEGDTDTVYLEPLDCEFIFGKGTTTPLRMKNGLYPWHNIGINYPKPPVNKKFYVAPLFGEEGISWSADNFTDEQLKIVQRFLEELNDHAGSLVFDGVVIMNNED